MVTPIVAEMVRNATVVIASGPDGSTTVGSGFFVAPGRVLTCAHNVHGRNPLWVRWNGQTEQAEVLACEPKARPAGGGVPAPDAAILAVAGFTEVHPVVPLSRDAPELGQDLYLYGMTKVRTGIPEWDGSLVRYSERNGENGELYKLTGGQIAPGHSGGPVLNPRTNQVCAMTKQTLDARGDLGGFAIPIAAALAILPDLWEANLACHGDGMEALRRAQVGYGSLPEQVAERISVTRAVPLLERQLKDIGRIRPASVGEQDREEWVARQLFTLRLGQLTAALRATATALDKAALEIMRLVACCLPLSNEPNSYWMPSDAAAALRVEWSQERPRVVRLSSDCLETADLMMLRAFYRTALVGRTLPSSAEVSPNGLPSDLVDDVFYFVSHKYNVDKTRWARDRAKVLDWMRDDASVIYLDGRALTDNALITRLLDLFGGFRFLIASREPATVAEEMLLDLRPPIDVLDEGRALDQLQEIKTSIGVKIVAA